MPIPTRAIVGIGRRVFELTEFLHDMLGVTDTGATFPHKVTMHIGCHGRRELGVVEPPMKLLKSVRGLTYCELPNIDECCGFGGTFSVKMPGTSLAMGGTKVENIVRSGRRRGRLERHQLPDAHRRHVAAQARNAAHPHACTSPRCWWRAGRDGRRTIEARMHANFTYHNPDEDRLRQGLDRRACRSSLPADAKVLLTYGGGSIKRNGVYDQVIRALQGRTMVEFGGIEPNPRYETCMKAVELVRAEGVDFLLAVGGGSVLDGTKFIAAAVPYEGKDPWDMLTELGAACRPIRCRSAAC